MTMSSGGKIRAGQAFVEIFTDNSRMRRGLASASVRLKKWGASVSSFGKRLLLGGGAVLAPLLAMIKQFASAGDALDKMSSRVGASVEFLSALGHAAQLGGTDIQAMEVGVRRMQKTAYDASRGLATAKDSFDELGVSVHDASGRLKGTESLFMETATALSRMENNTRKAALAQAVFGRAGTQLLPMLKDGKDGLLAAMDAAKRLGLVMTQEDAASAAAVTDAMYLLGQVLKMTVVRIGGQLAPILTDVADKLSRIVKPVIDWIRENKGLVRSIFYIAAGVTAAGAAFFTLGKFLSFAGGVLGGVSTALGVLGSLLGVLLSPLGLIAAAIAGGVVAWVKWTDSGQKAWSKAKQTFGQILSTAKRTFGGIFDALAAGDLALAGKVAFLGLKLAAIQGLNGLKSLVGDDVAAIAGFLMNGDITEAWNQTISILGQLWHNFTGMTTDAFVDAMSSVRKHWQNTVTGVAKGLAWLAQQPGFNELSGEAAADRRYQEQNVLRLTTVNKNIAQWQEIVDAHAEGRKARVGDDDMLVTDADVERAKQKIAELEAERQRLGQGHGAKKRDGLGQMFSAIDDGHDERMANIDEFDRRMKAIMGGSGAARRERTGRGTGALDDAARIAREELEAALAAAKGARDAAAKEALDRVDDPRDDPALEKSLSVVGTFNAAAVRGFGSSGPVERMAKGIDKVEKHTKDIARAFKGGEKRVFVN